MKYLIGITGYKQSGKDTAFQFLSQYLQPYVKLAFADALKQEVAELFGGSVASIEANKNSHLVRHVLQFWGQYQKTQFGDNYWVDKVKAKIEAAPDNAFIFITDVRFPYECLEDMCTIKVERVGQINTDYHPSETSVDRIHPSYHLSNSGVHLRDFERECKWMAGFIREFFRIPVV